MLTVFGFGRLAELVPHQQHTMMSTELDSKWAWIEIAVCVCVQLRGTLRRGEAVLDMCHGSWLHHLTWEAGVADGKIHRLWDAERSPIRPMERVPKPLPSDSRFRNDLLFLKVRACLIFVDADDSLARR